MKSSTESSPVGCLPALLGPPKTYLTLFAPGVSASCRKWFWACIIHHPPASPQRRFLNHDTTDNGGTLDTFRNSTYTVFRILAYFRPLASQPTEGEQYHLVASRGLDDEHFNLLVWAWEPEGVGLWPRFWIPALPRRPSNSSTYFYSTGPKGILRWLGGRGSQVRSLNSTGAPPPPHF